MNWSHENVCFSVLKIEPGKVLPWGKLIKMNQGFRIPGEEMEDRQLSEDEKIFLVFKNEE